MKKIKVIIVDDNQDSVEIIHYFIEQLPDFEIIDVCMDGAALIDQVMIKKPDLLLVDINMPGKNGLDAIKDCLVFSPNLKFIFITGYDEFAVQAFNISAVDYIVKPINKTRLYIALEKAKNLLTAATLNYSTNDWKNRLSIRFNGSIYFIPHNEIIFIEKIGKKCVIHTRKETYETNENIGELIKYLDSNYFFQTHRSYIVNLEMISHITPKNETFLIYFLNFGKHAHVSKLKIIDLQEKLSHIIKRL